MRVDTKRYSWMVVLLGGVLFSGLWLFVWQHVNNDRERTLREASREAMNLAKAFEEQVNSIIVQADHDMVILKEAYEKGGVANPVVATILQQTLKDTARFQIGITDAQGVFVVSSDNRALGVSYADREWFLRPREVATDSLYIGQTVASRASGKMVIPLTRRINKPDGSFGGVVHASLDTDYFAKLYNQLQLGSGAIISLNGMDGIIRFRQFHDRRDSGQDIRGGEIWRQAQISPYGVRLARGVSDGVERLFTYRVMPGYPLFILIALPAEDVLAPFEKNKKDYVYGAAALSCVIVLLCWLLIDRHRKQRVAVLRLQRSAEMQAVLKEIAEAAVLAPSLEELYGVVHHLVERVLPAKNFYISLLDEQAGHFDIVYCVDETHTVPQRRPVGKGLTDYVMSQRRAVYITASELARLRDSGEVLVRLVNYSKWAGAPLIDSTGKAFGALALFLVAEEEKPLMPDDLDTLSIIAAQVSLTIERRQVQETLRDSEERYRLIFEHAPLGLLFFDRQGAIAACNDYFVQIIGSSQKKLVGLNMLALPDKQLTGAVQTALDGHPCTFEGLYTSQTARKVTPVRCLFAPVGAAGLIQGGVGIVEDVTEQRRSREALQAANESLEGKVAERTQELQGANEALTAQNEELLSLHRLLKEMNETLELRVEKRTFELTTAHRELTEQYAKLMQAEEEVRNTGEYLRKLIQYANGPIIVWNPDFIITRFNKVFERLSGYAWEEVLGKPLSLLFPEESWRETAVLIEQSRSGMQWEAMEIPIRRKNGEVRIVLWNSANIYEADTVTLAAVIAQGQDITERVRRETELRRDAQLATRMQAALLSAPEPSEYLEIATVYQPFGYVGGDLYFLDWRYGGQLLRGFLVDATGHGLGTALQTTSLHVLLREVNECDLPLSEAMRRLNRRASEYFDEGAFAGALGFELDLETRELRWACAGIPRVWMSTRTVQEALECPGMSLGISEDEIFETHTRSIEVGDSFYFMTDGLSHLLGSGAAQPLDRYPEMVRLLQELSQSAECRDDATAVCIRVRALPQSSVGQDGWPQILRFNGYGDYQRLKGEVARILAEVTGKTHSLQEVAVHEALANALECRDGQSRNQKARIKFNRVGNCLIVRVKTSRIGFAGNAILKRLRSHPEDMFSFGEDASMGRGIPMMLSMSHKMTYNSEGTEVLLAWKL